MLSFSTALFGAKGEEETLPFSLSLFNRLNKGKCGIFPVTYFFEGLIGFKLPLYIPYYHPHHLWQMQNSSTNIFRIFFPINLEISLKMLFFYSNSFVFCSIYLKYLFLTSSTWCVKRFKTLTHIYLSNCFGMVIIIDFFLVLYSFNASSI